MVRSSAAISRLVYPNGLQAQTCTLLSPWSSNTRFVWCTRCGSYFDDENGVEEWLSFYQYLYPMVRSSAAISRLVYSSWLQAQTCTLSSLWSSNTRFVWCTRCCCSYFDDENGVEEWSSFHQYLHLMVRLCTLISRVVFPSWLPGQTRTLSSPGSSNTRFPWFYQEIRFCFL